MYHFILDTLKKVFFQEIVTDHMLPVLLLPARLMRHVQAMVSQLARTGHIMIRWFLAKEDQIRNVLTKLCPMSRLEDYRFPVDCVLQALNQKNA